MRTPKHQLVGNQHPKGRSKDPLGHTFVKVSAMDFDSSPADVIEMAVVSSGSSSCRSIPNGSVWDKYDDCYSIDISLSSLLDDILEAVPETGEDCHPPWTTPPEATTVELFGDAKPWNLDANADTISSLLSSREEDWSLSGPDTPLSHLSSVPRELVDPALQDALPSSASSLLASTDSVEDAHGSIPTTRPGHIESTVTQPLYGSQGVGGQPVVIDAGRGIWEAEALLAKRKQGKTIWYLVKWKGFPHGDNT
jgi:hypothetical protein